MQPSPRWPGEPILNARDFATHGHTATPHGPQLGQFGRTLVTSELALALGAVLGGAYLVARHGSALPPQWLVGSPFRSWLWPGIALIAVNGAGPIIVATGALRQRPWAHLGHPLIGLALIGWVTAELSLIGDVSAAQPLLLIAGVLVLLLGLSHVHRWRDEPEGGARGSVEVPWLW